LQNNNAGEKTDKVEKGGKEKMRERARKCKSEEKER